MFECFVSEFLALALGRFGSKMKGRGEGAGRLQTRKMGKICQETWGVENAKDMMRVNQRHLENQ